jgi:putative NIF3 family GTP cyclohydrolase 1 type 2
MSERARSSRRDFLTMTSAAAAAAPFLSFAALPRQMAVQEVIDIIVAAIPGAPLEETVDTIKIGDPAMHVTGIATTFLATSDVIKRASDRGANLIITHEPTFFNHLDETDWLAGDGVYRSKRQLAEERGVAIWRFHDYLHLVEPDGILNGMLRRLGWEDAPVSAGDRTDLPSICDIEPMTLLALAEHFKERLGIPHPLRAVGDPSMRCRRVALLLGAYGGRRQMNFLMDADVDVLVIGEVPEWETNIYVSDARSAGIHLALLELGHAYSEEPGMEYLVEWLQPKVEGIPVMHVPTGDVFVRM